MSILLGAIMFISPISLLMFDSWMMIWLFLELSSMSFIMFMIYGKLKTDWTMMYFLLQSLGSIFLLFTFMISEMNNLSDKIFSLKMVLICFSVLLKVGMFPFHFWVLKMSLYMNFKELILLLIIQKLAPLWVLTSFFVKLMLVVSVLGLLVSSLGQFSVISMIILMIFSSLSHMSWMFVSSLKFLMNVLTYFIFYGFILFLALSYFFKLSMFEYYMNFGSKSYVFMFMIMIYSLAGMPLLLGFFPKWLIFYSMLKMNMTLYIVFIFIIFTGMNFYIYNRLLYNFFLMVNPNKTTKKIFLLSSFVSINLFFPFNLILI